MRAFIAIEVPWMEDIQKLQRAINGRVKLVEPENMHLTLKFLGEVKESMIPEIQKKIENCLVPKFDITIKGVGFFPSERYVKVIWVGVEDNGSSSYLMRCIDNKLNSLGFRKEKGYVPHITIARVKSKISIESLKPFKNYIFGEFVAKEVKIKKSTLTESGPIYEDIKVFHLKE